ncbi:YopX family protein [Campylobacter jejuni]|uniref:YopX family protein n=1 Tax=Campylobacter jejuni TaxID=197 RepID=UPI003A836B88
MKLKDFDFRIWDKTKEEFLKKEPTLIKLDNERVIAGRISRFYANTADIADMFIGNGNDLEIELWTGYFDKNGNKIYENDILEYESLEELYHITRDNTYKMFKIEIFSKNFNNKIYKRKAEPDISFLKVFKSEKNMKVIGNIHNIRLIY